MRKNSSDPDKKDMSIQQNPNTLIIFFVAIAIFCIITFAYASYITSQYTTSTKIIKVKYFAYGILDITDECGHPMDFLNSLPKNLNLSGTYEITYKTTMFGETITNYTLVEEEKYIKNC